MAAPHIAKSKGGVWAVHLDRQSDIRINEPSKLGFSASSGRIIASYCYDGVHAPNPKIGNDNPKIMMYVGNNSTGDAFVVAHINDQNNKPALQAALIVGGKVFQYFSGYGAISYNGPFHQVVVQLDGMATKGNAIIDGVVYPNTVSVGQSPVSMGWSGVDLCHFGGLVLGIHPQPDNMGHLGNFASAYLAIGAPSKFDITSPDVIDYFWDAKNQWPRRQDLSGLNFLPGVTPNVWLDGPYSYLRLNGAQATYSAASAKLEAQATYSGPGVTQGTYDAWSAPVTVASRRPTPRPPASAPPVAIVYHGRLRWL